jgi:hypothetical protein
MSDFPEFDRAYQTVLVKDKEDRFEQLAAEANFNVYHSDIWRGTGRKFAELIVRECSDLFEVQWGEEKLTGNDVGYVVKKHFGVK